MKVLSTGKTLELLWNGKLYNKLNKVLKDKFNTKLQEFVIKSITPYLDNKLLISVYKTEKRIENEYVTLLIDLNKPLDVDNVVITIRDHHPHVYIEFKRLKKLIKLILEELKNLNVKGLREANKHINKIISTKKKVLTDWGEFNLSPDLMSDNENNIVLIAKNDKGNMIKLLLYNLLPIEIPEGEILDLRLNQSE